MSYLDRLKKTTESGPVLTAKTDRSPFVSSVSGSGGTFRENIEHNKTESEAALQAFVGLVRIAAACDHHVLLHRDAIAATLDESDKSELLTNTREDRQAWAAMLAHRLTRSRIHE